MARVPPHLALPSDSLEEAAAGPRSYRVEHALLADTPHVVDALTRRVGKLAAIQPEE
jgi:hypothetical protein